MIVLRSLQLLTIICWFSFLEFLNKPLFVRRESRTGIQQDLEEWDNNSDSFKPLQIG